jgi:hypothetical protein
MKNKTNSKNIFMLRFILIFAAFLSISTVNAQAPYCSPATSFGCGFGDQITEFYTTGGVTDISNIASGCSAGNYSYNNTQPLTVNSGESFTIHVKAGPSFSQGTAIWIDWNNDFDFDDADEHMWTSNSSTTALQTATLTTPASQAAGTFRMRVRCSYNSFPTDPCANQTYGEVEDYDVVVQQGNQIVNVCNGDIPAPFNNVDSVTGGSGNYAYVWQSSVDFGNTWVTAAGNYDSINYVPVTSLLDTVFYQRMVIDQSCGDSAYSNIIEVHVPDTLKANPTVYNLSCNGSMSGSITTTVNGGFAPYSYVWSTGNTTSSISGLAAATYSVTITDNNGCVATSSMTVTEPTILVSATVLDSNISCNGLANGGATAFANGGTPSYTYAWSNAATTASITGVIAGTYSVTITDANGCTDSSSVMVMEPALLVSSSVIDSNISCNGLADGGATASAAGGTAPYMYAWSNAATTVSITGVLAGTYSVTITDANGCTDSSSTTVSEPALLVSASVLDSNITCNGLAEGGATASAAGGTIPYTYAWSNAATTASITGVIAGTYSVTITDANGCTDSSSTMISEPTLLVSSSVLDSNITCNGLSDGGATAFASGGVAPYMYAWSNAATTASITGVMAGTYSVTVTDANGCTDSSSTTVSEPALLVSSSVIDSNISCNGLADGGATASAAGGTFPYTYAWSNSATTASITGVMPGTYSVTITDVNGCTSTSSATITEPTVLSDSITMTMINCFGDSTGTATVIGMGGTTPYTYAWPSGNTTSTESAMHAGLYVVTITDANGCTAMANVTMIENPALLAFVSGTTNQLCSGDSIGSITANAGGGVAPYSYNWSNGDVSNNPTGLPAGAYTLTVTDALGCMQTTTATITEPNPLSAQFVNVVNSTCNGSTNGSAEAFAAGGTAPYSYNWNNGTTTSVNTGLDTGYYSVVIIDANGCSLSDSVMMTQPDSLIASASIGNDVSCFAGNDGTANSIATGGTLPYVYAWSNGTSGTTTTGLIAGTHTVTVSDANNCSSIDTVVISQPAAAVSVTTTATDASCNGMNDGGAIALGAGGTPGYSYSWSNGAVTSSISGLAAGTYTVTTTDTNGCSITDNIVITEPTPIVVTIATVANVTCFGGNDGSAQVLGSGGTAPYVYVWNTGDNTSMIDTLTMGVYTAVVMDANGCVDSSSTTVTEPMPLTMDLGADTTICSTDTLTLDASAAFTTFDWDNGDTTQTRDIDANVVGTGTANYYVTVQNAAGCETSDTISVTVAAPVTTSITMNGDRELCIYESITLDAGPGFASYNWSNSSNQQLNTIYSSNWPDGTNIFTVTVTDVNGCIGMAMDSIIALPAVIVDLGPDTVVWQNAVYTLDADSIFGSYLWPDGSTNQTFDVTPSNAGLITVTVTDTLTLCEGVGEVMVEFALDVPTIANFNIATYPNPAYDVLNIEVSNFINAGELDIKIMSVTGATVLSSSYPTNGGSVNEAIDISKLNPGTYFIEFYTNGQKTMKSFIVR